MNRLRAAAFTTFLLVLWTPPAVAQLSGVPIPYSPPPTDRPGITTVTVFGAHGLNDDSGKNWAFGAMASYGVARRLELGLGVATLNPVAENGRRSTTLQWAGNADLLLIRSGDREGRRSTTISLQAGAGYAPIGNDGYEVNVPVGVAVGAVRELGGLAVEGWFAPRLHVRNRDLGDASATQVGGGITVGATAGFALGLSLQAAVDVTAFGEDQRRPVRFPQSTGLVASLGLRYRVWR